MPTIEFGGKTFTVDEDGFIDDYTKLVRRVGTVR
jgi:hypothetical protein